jgi:isopropylmalate/homocitrate/citramalate synthase
VSDQHIHISDCTLRDARYAPGVFLSTNACLVIAQQLGKIGVDEIEIGKVSFEEEEKKIMTAINELGLNTSCIYFCLNSSTINDAIDYVSDIGCRTVCVSIPSSDLFRAHKLKRSFRAACKLMERAVRSAACRDLTVVFSGEDASRADLDQLKNYIAAGADAGASRFRFAESVACLNPNEMKKRIGILIEESPIEVEIHCHNAYGLSVANTLAAVQAGAKWVSVTIGGIGERGGNTPLEAILLYLHQFLKHDHFNLEGLKPLVDYVAEQAKMPFNRFAPIIGDDAFQYELGNQFNACQLYESYSPELVGNKRDLVIGRHCDVQGMTIMLEQTFDNYKDNDVSFLYYKIKNYVQNNQTTLNTKDLKRLFDIG